MDTLESTLSLSLEKRERGAYMYNVGLGYSLSTSRAPALCGPEIERTGASLWNSIYSLLTLLNLARPS